MSYTPTAWKTGDIVSSVKLNKIETELVALDTDKANIDGYYESMTVGNAEQLVATVGVEDSVPFNFRTTGGSADVGDRKTMEVVGGTVAWNQSVRKQDVMATATVASVTFTNNDDGTLTVNGTADSASTPAVALSQTVISGHVYALLTHQNSMSVYLPVGGGWTAKPNNIIKATSGGRGLNIIASIANGESFSNVKVTPQLIDLTQMFGSTIADYIYSLEQANAGAGVAWFRKLFPKPYYAYNAGELMSVKTSAYKAVGFNQWDEEWEVGSYSSTGEKVPTQGGRIRSVNKIPVLPNTSYYALKGVYILCQYDESEGFVSFTQLGTDSASNVGHTFTTGASTHYITFATYANYGATYNNDICINLHWDGERDGEYEPYETHTYALDSDLELRGIPKLDADNQLYYDGDIYESDGTVTRRFGIVDLGTLEWYEQQMTGYINFYSDAIGLASPDQAKGFCSKLYTFSTNQSTLDKVMYISATRRVNLRDDAYNSADDLKVAINGVYLVYELATPTEETADPFQTPQIVNDFGTEEFVDTRTIPIPVGHNSKYQANLRAKLEMAPNSPSGDGDYIVRQASGQNTYVPITFPADELPAAPTTDGNYVLKCTVSSGTATFEWEAQT